MKLSLFISSMGHASLKVDGELVLRVSAMCDMLKKQCPKEVSVEQLYFPQTSKSRSVKVLCRFVTDAERFGWELEKDGIVEYLPFEKLMDVPLVL